MPRLLLGLSLLISTAPLSAQALPSELDGWPVIELTRATRGNGEVWVGTYGHGVLVRAKGAPSWRRVQSDTSKTSLSWDFVHAISFGPRDQVWVGTIGNGWGLSRDEGRTWRNWTFSELGPEWQYVAPEGIRTFGDTTLIATADGAQITVDDGAHWVALIDNVGPAAKGPAERALAVLQNEYLLGASAETVVFTHRPGQYLWLSGNVGTPAVAISLAECLRPKGGDFCTPLGGVNAVNEPIAVLGRQHPAPAPATRPWQPPFARPIAFPNNQHIDQTYRFGSTMGGNFQPHQGVEFNNADGTTVLAIGDGEVVWSGPAERGALTVAIRHDSLLRLPNGESRVIFSTYYHNSALKVAVGQRVHRGEQLAEVGHTGRATNDHLHLEVHAAPTDSVGAIVDPNNRFPAYVTNPELWIAPLPGTGIIAGQVFDATGAAVPQARVYGIKKPLPRETPFAFAETYGPRNQPSPMYGEHFAISDVPEGEHLLRVKIGERWVERRVTVAAAQMTWVEFRP